MTYIVWPTFAPHFQKQTSGLLECNYWTSWITCTIRVSYTSTWGHNTWLWPKATCLSIALNSVSSTLPLSRWLTCQRKTKKIAGMNVSFWRQKSRNYSSKKFAENLMFGVLELFFTSSWEDIPLLLKTISEICLERFDGENMNFMTNTGALYPRKPRIWYHHSSQWIPIFDCQQATPYKIHGFKFKMKFWHNEILEALWRP